MLQVEKSRRTRAATLKELMAAFRDRTPHREYRLALARTACRLVRS